MKSNECARESEVLALLTSGLWPHRCDPELRTHVNECRACQDAVVLKLAFRQALVASRLAAPPLSPSLLWWRAQLRRRHNDAQKIARPFTAAYQFALAVNLLAGTALGVLLLRRLGGSASALSSISPFDILHLAPLWTSVSYAFSWNSLVLIPCAVAVALLSGVAMYLAAEQP